MIELIESGVTLPISHTKHGLRIKVDSSDWRMAIAWLVGRWRGVPMPDLVSTLERRSVSSLSEVDQLAGPDRQRERIVIRSRYDGHQALEPERDR